MYWIEEAVSRGKSPYDASLAWMAHARRKAGSQLNDQFQDRYARTFLNQFVTVMRWLEDERKIEPSEIGRLDPDQKELSRYREQLFQLLESGKKGEPILKEWRSLRLELENQIETDLKAHVESLPFKMLIPLLLLLFPAFLVLLFGPIMQMFLSVI
jgi:hypothetical protein